MTRKGIKEEGLRLPQSSDPITRPNLLILIQRPLHLGLGKHEGGVMPEFSILPPL